MIHKHNNKNQINYQKPLVSIIIVNWNGKEYLTDCLNSLQNISYPNYEIILVDNASTDEYVEYVKDNFPEILIIKNKKNLGYAEANNKGVHKANGEYILFLNNDTTVKSDFITELVKVMESDPGIGVCQSKILLMDNPKRLDCVGAYLTLSGFLYHLGWGKLDDYNKVIEVFSSKGACMLSKREVLDKVGLFDEDFFAYFEETDLCWRVWLAGYKILFVPSSIIYHKVGATSSRMPSSFIQFHSFKNRICSLIKNLETINLLKILPVHLLFCIGGIFIYLSKLEFKTSLAIVKAILWNIKNVGNTLKKRSLVQRKIRKISDVSIMPIIMKKADFRYYYYLFAGKLEKYQQ